MSARIPKHDSLHFAHFPGLTLRSAARLALVGVALTASTARLARAEAAAKKPNILLIVADDLGYGDPGFQGGKDIPTPNLDALAASGVRFTNGYVSCPVCSPTRAGLNTGRYQQRFGHELNPGQAQSADGVTFGLPLTEKTLASALHDAGYNTAIVGKWHLGSADGYRPLQRGFDEFYGFLGGAHPYVQGVTGSTVEGVGANGNANAQAKAGANAGGGQGRQGQRAARRAAGDQQAASPNNGANTGGAGQPIYRGDEPTDFPAHLTTAFGDEAAAFVARKKDKPFYLYLTFNAVHNPLQPDEEHIARFSHIENPKRRAYAALLSGLDDAVGTVLKSLHDSGQDENTLVFFISDNGGPQAGNGSNNTPLRGDKASVWEGGIRVPYVVRWTGKLPAGTTYDQPAISLDLTATAAAAAGATLGGEGRPVDGVDLLPHLLGKVSTPPHDALYWRFGEQHAIRRGNYKLLKTADSKEQLYDLAADIGEKNDLAAAHPEIVSELEGLYAAWNSQLAEPLWKKGPAAGQRNAGNRAGRRAAQAAQTAADETTAAAE